MQAPYIHPSPEKVLLLLVYSRQIIAEEVASKLTDTAGDPTGSA